jgi:hypothetical protein
MQDVRTGVATHSESTQRFKIFRVSFTNAERTDSEDLLDARPSRPDMVLFWEDVRAILETRSQKTVRKSLTSVQTLHS